ncbi:hypothetical protein [Frankia sp. QA3]|uniref:hypothetical protein n=1 Tax=Frankia sp. QA3 TaxID=710111 RepID=UPI000269BB6D|nr:hypothetical protein [Frankia sp. QA3]EIV92628.1 hypothetical protein FraQA3DRAFT_2220 [Frankia sp. QA3]
MARIGRQSVIAGVSTLVGVLVGVIAGFVSGGFHWAAFVCLVGTAVIWALLEAWRAGGGARDRRSRRVSTSVRGTGGGAVQGSPITVGSRAQDVTATVRAGGRGRVTRSGMRILGRGRIRSQVLAGRGGTVEDSPTTIE